MRKSKFGEIIGTIGTKILGRRESFKDELKNKIGTETDSECGLRLRTWASTKQAFGGHAEK